ncbi:MAG: hypothetical protein ABJA78_16770 [Ferruginibacter sp.]
MTINNLHTISGCLVLLAILFKIILHYYLDKLYDQNIGLSSIFLMPLKHLKPYKAAVNSQHTLLKRICNFMLPLAVMFLLLNLILGLMIYFN